MAFINKVTVRGETYNLENLTDGTHVVRLPKLNFDDEFTTKTILGNHIGDINSKVTTLQENVAANSANIISLNDSVDSMKNKVDNIDTEASTYYATYGNAIMETGEEEQNVFTLYEVKNGKEEIKGQFIINGGGGGGGSASTSIVKLTNENKTTVIDASVGMPVILKFTFASTDDGISTGNGTCQISINGVLCSTIDIQQGLNLVDITKYLKPGTNNVRVKCIDIYGNYKMLIYTVSVVDLRIESIFDDSAAFTGEIQFKYTPFGAIQKTIHILVDDVEIATVPTAASGRQFTQVIQDLPHGTHRLEVYADGTINDTTIESNHLVYDVICVDDGDNTPMIASVYNVTTLSHGSQVSIPYIVYDPSILNCNIDLTVYTIDENGNEDIYSKNSIMVNREKQYWNTRRYPIGDVYFKISYKYTDINSGELVTINKLHKVNIVESEINIEPVTNDLELYLTSNGRSNNESNPNNWSYGDYSTTFENVNWTSTGWLEDENGDAVLRLNGDAKAEISFMPFNSDLKVYGKTIELEFTIRDVNNRDAVVIDCMSGNRGFSVTADKATLRSEQTTISCNYRDEERIRLSFVIESNKEYRMMSIYLNGVLSSVKQYPANDNFQQATPVTIKIGSPYCGVDIYTIRSYSTALTFSEITDNYIYDISDIINKYILYDANNIYDEYNQISYEELKKRISVMTIVGDLPQSKGDKKTVNIKYNCLFNANYSFEDTASIDVQGTSSQFYVRKNYKIKCGEKHQHDDGQVPTNTFCLKADYAESTGTHNTQNANLIHTLYSEKVPPQNVDERCRTTIYGYPIVVFHQQNESSTPEFIGSYNFNFDKNSLEAFGFTEDYDVESWEFCNNTSDDCNFLSPLSDKWSENFEARYPEDCTDISRFRVMHDWVVSTRQDTATGMALSQPYTDVDGNIHTTDNAAYRLAKFKTEFEEHFDMHYALIYYVYSFVALMVDQRAKNLFLTYWGDTGKWYAYFYDNDLMWSL